MTFLTVAALLVGLLVGTPIMAHLLRRGRARQLVFPPASLVPPARSVARERSRLEDRALLAVRGALIACLAVIGATPLVRCSRVALARHAGASVAVALILDDSQSMRASTSSGERWRRAKQAARELLASAHEGDAVCIVLGGQPARLSLAPTTDLGLARRTLDELEVSDRSTDLAAAVEMARSSLAGLSQRDKRVVLLSDLAGEAIPDGTPKVWTPLGDLAEAVDNCAVCAAERHGNRVSASVACSSESAARGRTLRVAGSSDPGSALAPRAGVQHLALALDAKLALPELELSPKDALLRDDRAAVAPEAAALTLGVVSDAAHSSAQTGGAPLLEQALSALGADTALRPLAIVPDEARDLEPLSALMLDDPAGITPEARAALDNFVEHGGVALALLGPSAEHAPLGATLEPFARGAVRWEQSPVAGADVASLAWLGVEAASLSEFAPQGRAALAGADLLGAQITGRFADGKPLLAERSVGRGLLGTLALPVSIELSDLALRPGFLALLDHFVSEARARRGAVQSRPGAEWTFPASSRVAIDGPGGPLELAERVAPGGGRVKYATPALAGRYQVTVDDSRQERLVTLDPAEVTDAPRASSAASNPQANAANPGRVDASPEFSTFALGLLGLELALRVARLGRRARATSAPARRSRANRARARVSAP